MTTYRTLHTAYGLAAMAQAEATGSTINLTHMAVGDGNGNPVTPSELQTHLVREVFRAPVNRVYQDPDQANKFSAELVIPATEGGFVMREVGIFDADGSLFTVGNLPVTYKPMASEGAYGDTVVRIDFLVANADVVTLQIDPNVAVATQTWITNNITAGALLPGGTTGQLLMKSSNADGDVEWGSPDVVNITVDTIEEAQTLAADQVTVDLVETTTRGLALYIDGVRLRRDQWTADPVIETRLSLAVSYPAGTPLICAQNEPTGSAPTPLERSKNLSDLDNAANARANLGVYSKAETRQMAPAGQVAYFARNTAPAGWLKANGAAISRTAYADLFAAIGTTFGPGNGFTSFTLPDLRGEFVRSWSDGRGGVDAGRFFGSWQDEEMKLHSHTNEAYTRLLQPPYGGSLTGNDTNGSGSEQAVGPGDSADMVAVGGAETRPRNVALLACIKY